MKNLEKLTTSEIAAKAQAAARMKLETTDFRKLDRNDLLNYTRRFQILLHHLKKNGFDEEIAIKEFHRDRTEMLEKITKQGQLDLIKAQETWKENSKEAWAIFKKTIAPYWGEDMMKWTHKFHDEVSGAKTEQIETYVKERIIEGITSDFTSMSENDFKRKLIKRFESREFLISLDRQIYMSEDDAKDLRLKAEGQVNRGILFFNRQIVLKPRIRR